MHYYRLRSSGQWCGAGMSAPQDVDWLARYAAALGVEAADIEEVESEIDPRTGTLLVEAPPAPVVDAELDAITAIIAKADTDITAAEVKTALLRFLRRRARQGTL